MITRSSISLRPALVGAATVLVALVAACSSTADPTPNVQATIDAVPTASPVVERVVETVVTVATPTPGAPQPTSTPRVIVVTPTAVAPTTVPDPRVVSSTVQLDPDNSLIAYVTVNLDSAASVYVEYGNSSAGDFLTPTTLESGTTHTVPIVRLRADSTYNFTPVAVASSGSESRGTSGSFKTGLLPEQLTTVSITAEGRPTSPLVAMDYRTSTQKFLLMLDQDSEIVWYYAIPNQFQDETLTLAGVNGMKQKGDFSLIYVAGSPSRPCCIREVSPLGKQTHELVFSELNKTAHHDFLILSDTEILYLADVPTVIDDSANGGSVEQQIVAESLRIWDQQTNTTREVWNSLDFWDPTDPDQREQWSGDPIRWIHGNSLTLGPQGNYVMSSRNLNQVISISSDFKRIEWRLGLGDEGSPASDYRFEEPENRFYRQHTASQLPSGNILVFDNGATRPEEQGGQYSRALELSLDTYDLIVSQVWEYSPEEQIYSRNISSAWRLENGNTLINFGNRDDLTVQPVVAVEVTRSGEVVYRLEMQSEISNGRFRAYAFDSVMGERPAN